jgi:cytochrome c oxidase subunit II
MSARSSASDSSIDRVHLHATPLMTKPFLHKKQPSAQKQFLSFDRGFSMITQCKRWVSGSPKYKWVLQCLLLLTTYFTLGPAFAAYQLDMTPGVTDISSEVYQLHQLMFKWCVAIAVVVFGAMLWSVIHHRKSKGHQAAHFHENTLVEIIWTIIPFAILILMAIPATRVLIQMNDTSSSALTVKITASQWKWHYEYLEYDQQKDIKVGFFSVLSTPKEHIEKPLFSQGLLPSGLAKFSGERTDVTREENYLLEVDHPLVIPTGKKVRFLITSNDVIHAWWVPAFGIKRDAIPGFMNELWTFVPAGKEGIYRGQCAELCGKDHGFMPIVVEAKDPKSFDQWLAQTKTDQKKAAEEAASASDKTYTKEELMALGEKEYLARCSACHQANGEGLPPTFPALKGSKIATGPVKDHIDIVLKGRNMMPAFKETIPANILAAIITYERNAWGNNTGDTVQPKDVK